MLTRITPQGRGKPVRKFGDETFVVDKDPLAPSISLRKPNSLVSKWEFVPVVPVNPPPVKDEILLIVSFPFSLMSLVLLCEFRICQSLLILRLSLYSRF